RRRHTRCLSDWSSDVCSSDLAAHGFSDTQFPERSGLVLGVDPNSRDDGLLQVREIIRLSFSADLVTLSACNTGVGKLQGEEGIKIGRASCRERVEVLAVVVRV